MPSFGFSKTFAGLVVSRCIAGSLNGNLGVVKSMMGELTDSTNRARAFGFFPLVWAIGGTIGPLAGGSLSRPHERFPTLFGNWFWREYPYLLPCLFSATYCIFCLVFAWLFLKETVKRHHPLQDEGEPVPSLRTVLTEPVVLSTANYFWLAFLDIAFRALQPLFFATPTHLGGLGMSPAVIGLCLGTLGLLGGVVQGLFFARVQQIFGLKRLFFTSIFCFIPLFATFPVTNRFAREWGLSPAVWALVAFQFITCCVTECAFGCAFLYMTASVQNPRALGSVHGIGQTTASFARALAPAVATSLFAYTLQNDWLGGLGVYVILITLSTCGLPLVCRLPEKAWEHQ